MYNSKKGVVYLVLVRVVYEGQEKIIDELKLMLEDMQIKKSSLKILEKGYSGGSFIDVVCDPSQYTDQLKNKIFNVISQNIYKFIIKIFIDKEINYFFDNSYFFIKYDEIDEVKEKVIDILINDRFINDNDKFFIDKKNSILKKIQNCIEENNEININGFIRFRMRELFEDIETIVDRVVEKHMVEKEYNEFIKLLKYFVEIQESKIQEVNIVINKRGSYTIFDENNNDIYDLFLDDLNDFNTSMMNVNKDDLLISGLITNSPEKIIIHGVENSLNIEIIETIKQVFEDKVNLCYGCSNCVEIANKLIK